MDAGGLPPGLTLEVGTKVLAAAAASRTFFDAFLKDPKAAYKAQFGDEFLPGQNVEVRPLEDGSTALYLPDRKQGVVIPKDFELSDDMLAMVVGGKGSSTNGKSNAGYKQANSNVGGFLDIFQEDGA